MGYLEITSFSLGSIATFGPVSHLSKSSKVLIEFLRISLYA